ncbi:MAG: transcriptional regulator [Nitrososphaerota archaeon]
MPRDQQLGALILVASIVGIILYGWLVLFSNWSLLVLQLTAFAGVALILGVLAWIGYTLATTPPPKPLEEIEKELSQEAAESKPQEK